MRSKTVIAHAMVCAIALSIAVTGCTRPGGASAPAAPAAAAAEGAVGALAENGPAPTQSSVRSARGPFAYSTRSVRGTGFASGTLYTPNQAGTFGAILLLPPFMINASALAPFAQRYASNGFVVLAMNARSTADFPSSRATQGRAALTFLKTQAKVDSGRVGVGGYSMGGGATMEMIAGDPSIKAGVPMVPWHLGRTFPRNQVPVMILAAGSDAVAGNSSHSIPFYNSVPASTPKGLAIFSGQSHFMPSSPPAGMTQLGVAWMKYFVDGDARYKQFIVNPGGTSRFSLSGLN